MFLSLLFCAVGIVIIIAILSVFAVIRFHNLVDLVRMVVDVV